jgi:tRNA(Ile)-lysidine synthase
MELVSRVRRTIRRYGLAQCDTRVVVAVSGGSDSVALVWIARELDRARDLTVAGLAHFNHQLRATADGDERFCRALADRIGWPIVVGRGDVADYAARHHLSLEHAARTLRHEFFSDARARLGADAVAVGHTRDDQAETFLLRLMRGAGARGLAAMHPRNGAIVRPLLQCRRAELRGYLSDRGLDFVEDETNADPSIPRNRVRMELLPLLEARFNPRVVEELASAADLARDEWAWMSAESDELLARATLRTEPRRVLLDPDVLAAASPALRRMTIWRTMTRLAGSGTVGAAHAEQAIETLAQIGGAFDAPGLRVERDASGLVLTGRPPGTAGRWRPAPQNLFDYSLSIPGEVASPEGDWVVSAERGDWNEPVAAGEFPGKSSLAVVRSDVCGAPLRVRNRRPGDRFCPAELGHARKVQDFLVDKKVARDRRDSVPIVADSAGRIIWVAGYGIDVAFRVTDPSQGVLILRLRQLGGPA